MSNTYDVIIAGAGPVGLLLACELGLAGTSVVVLEREPKAESPWKCMPLGMRGLHTPAIEALYRRGLMAQAMDSHERPPLKKDAGFKFGGHFSGIMINANKLELERWKYRLQSPSLVPGPTNLERVEKALSERAESLGVTILRGHEVTSIASQDDDGVTVEAGEGRLFRGKWLVGCDGGRSVVRKATGFGFVGTEPSWTGFAVKCDFDHPENLGRGFHVTDTGLYIVSPNTLHLVDFDGAAFDRTQPITLEHIQDVFLRTSGVTDAKPTRLHLATSFTDRAMQATSYRRGRVLLAGDAAHIHGPLGAQGMNAGLGDAMNLGWKLAATIRREAASAGAALDMALLDTYERERHPVGASVLEWTRAQTAALRPDPHGAALRLLVRDVVETTDGANLFMDRIWGLSQRYIPVDEEHTHPAIGRSAPDFELEDGSRLGPKLKPGRGLFLDFRNDAASKEAIGLGKYESRVDYLGMTAKDQCGLRALLIRPDGFVAWAADDGVEPDVDGVKVSLEQWFGF